MKRLDIVFGEVKDLPEDALWKLSGVTSNERYTTRAEKDQLAAKQVTIGRPRGHARGTDPDSEERQVVGHDTGRAPRHL